MNKKFVVIFALVAALAANNAFGQVLQGGIDSAPAQKSAPSASAPASAPSTLGDISVHVWQEQVLRGEILGLATDQLEDASAWDKDRQVVGFLGGGFGAKAKFGDVFYLKPQGFYSLGKNGLDYITGIMGAGADIGRLSLTANVGFPLMTLRGFNIGADIGFAITPDFNVYGWGNFLVNTRDYKNNVVSTLGATTEGTLSYSQWDAGLGAEGVSGRLYFAGQLGFSGNNNVYKTLDGDKLLTKSEVLAKIGFIDDLQNVFGVGFGAIFGSDIIGATTQDAAPSTKYQVLFFWKHR